MHVIRGEAKEVARLGEMVNMELPEYQDRIRHPRVCSVLRSCFEAESMINPLKDIDFNFFLLDNIEAILIIEWIVY